MKRYSAKWGLLAILIIGIHSWWLPRVSAATFTVDDDGNGTHTTIAAALTAAGNSTGADTIVITGGADNLHTETDISILDSAGDVTFSSDGNVTINANFLLNTANALRFENIDFTHNSEPDGAFGPTMFSSAAQRHGDLAFVGNTFSGASSTELYVSMLNTVSGDKNIILENNIFSGSNEAFGLYPTTGTSGILTLLAHDNRFEGQEFLGLYIDSFGGSTLCNAEVYNNIFDNNPADLPIDIRCAGGTLPPPTPPTLNIYNNSIIGTGRAAIGAFHIGGTTNIVNNTVTTTSDANDSLIVVGIVADNGGGAVNISGNDVTYNYTAAASVASEAINVSALGSGANPVTRVTLRDNTIAGTRPAIEIGTGGSSANLDVVIDSNDLSGNTTSDDGIRMSYLTNNGSPKTAIDAEIINNTFGSNTLMLTCQNDCNGLITVPTAGNTLTSLNNYLIGAGNTFDNVGSQTSAAPITTSSTGTGIYLGAASAGFVPSTLTNDTATTSLGTPVGIALLDDDTPGSGSLQIMLVTSPTVNGGSINITNATDTSGGANVTYTPPSSFTGVDTFYYTVADGNGFYTSGRVDVTIAATPTLAVELNAATAAGAEGNPVDITASTLDLIISGGITSTTRTVDVSLSPVAPASSADINQTSATVTIPAGDYSTPQTLALPVSTFGIVGDSVVEPDEEITVTLTNPSANLQIDDANSDSTTQTSATYTITNDDTAAISWTDASGAEDAGTINVTLSVDNPVQGGFSVDVNSSDGSATTADNDYTAIVDETVSFTGTAEETSAVIVAPTTDTRLESDETLTLNLGNPQGTFGAVTITDTATVTINNDDGATATLSVQDATEGTTTAIAITLDKPNNTGNPISFDVITAASSTTVAADFDTAIPTTMVIADGQDTAQEVVTVSDDALYEGAETLTLQISTANSDITITTDTDSATITESVTTALIAATTSPAAEAGPTDGVFTVGLSGKTNVTGTSLTFNMSSGGTASAADITAALPTSVEVADNSATTTVSFTPVDDSIDDDGETVELTLTSAPTGITLPTTSTASIPITDNDTAGLVISPADPLSLAETGEESQLFTMTLTSQPTADVTIPISVSSSECTVDSAQVILSAANWDAGTTVTVTAVDDALADGDLPCNLETGAPTSDDTNYAALTAAGTPDVDITITDDESASLRIDDVSLAEGNTGTTTFTFTVTLSVASTQTVTVAYASSDDSATTGDGDYADTSGTLMFAPSVTEQNIAVIVNGDVAIEDDEQFTVTLSNPSNATLVDDVGIGTILNDDTVEIDVASNNTSIANGDTTPDAADGTDFGTVERDADSVTQTFTIANTGTVALDLTGSPLVTITGTDAADFLVTAVPANSVPSNDSTTFDITFDPSALGTRMATVTIANTDADENPYTFAIQGQGVQPNRQLIQNGRFDAGLTNWGLFGDYDFNLSGGVLELWRLSPGWNGAVLFQAMTEFLPAGAPVRINLALANSSSVEKSVNILLRDANFDDTISCAVTLPANSFFQGVTIEDVTTIDWSSAVFSVRVLDQDNAPAVRVDNISVQYLPTSGISSYSCTGYDAPEATNLVRNGTFSTPTLREWLLFGSYDFTVDGDIVSFYRLAGGAQIAALFQQVTHQLDANVPVRAQLQIANPGTTAKDITVLVRNDSWTDSLRCRYTVPAGALPTTITIEGVTATVWEQSLFVVRVNNDDGEPAIEVDNASLVYDTSFVFGTTTTCTPATFATDTPEIGENEKMPATILPDAGLSPDNSGAVPAPITPPNPGGIPEIPGF